MLLETVLCELVALHHRKGRGGSQSGNSF